MSEEAAGSALNEPKEKKVEALPSPSAEPKLPLSVERLEALDKVGASETKMPSKKAEGWLGKAIGRVKRIQVVSYIAVAFGAASYFFGAWLALFWVLVALAVELGFWDDFKTKVKYGLAMQGRPNTAAAWGAFASRSGVPIG